MYRNWTSSLFFQAGGVRSRLLLPKPGAVKPSAGRRIHIAWPGSGLLLLNQASFYVGRESVERAQLVGVRER